jgi:hypothetical protein
MPPPEGSPNYIGTGEFSRTTPVRDMPVIAAAENAIDLAQKVIPVIEAIAGISKVPTETADEIIARMRQEALDELLGR